jgi:chromatin segregation and condensation protein Rec8/ScpA/Scc1 (kleisin family)
MNLPDLVLAVRRAELDIRPLPLLPLLQEHFNPALGLDALSENVWHAATLIHLKITRLLPPLPCPPPEPDAGPAPVPRLDPEHLRQATSFLRERLESPATHSPSPEPAPDPEIPPGLNLHEIARLARKALETALAHKDIDDAAPPTVRIEDMIRLLEQALAEAEKAGDGRAFGLDALLDLQPDATRRVGLFLAVLELARLARIHIEQREAFAPIAVHRPAETSV